MSCCGLYCITIAYILLQANILTPKWIRCNLLTVRVAFTYTYWWLFPNPVRKTFTRSCSGLPRFTAGAKWPSSTSQYKMPLHKKTHGHSTSQERQHDRRNPKGKPRITRQPYRMSDSWGCITERAVASQQPTHINPSLQYICLGS